MARRLAVCAVGITSIVSLVVVQGAHGAGSPMGPNVHLVLGGPAAQYSATGSTNAFAWTTGHTYFGGQTFVRISGGTSIHVNPPGSLSFAGGIDGDRMMYLQERHHNVDVMMFNLKTHHRSTVAAIDTKDLELHPTLSGGRILFTRLHFQRKVGDFRHTTEKAIVYDLKTHKSRILASARHGWTAFAGQINGKWASWTSCLPSGCRAVSMDLATGHKRTWKAPVGKLPYSLSTTPNGTLFFAVSGFHCGAHVYFVRWAAGHQPQTLFRLPPKRDIDRSYAYVDATGRTHVLFGRESCSGKRSDVYAWMSPIASGPPPTPKPKPSSPPTSPSPSPSPSSCGLPVCTLMPPRVGVGVARALVTRKLMR